jgi:hypothetical protein
MTRLVNALLAVALLLAASLIWIEWRRMRIEILIATEAQVTMTAALDAHRLRLAEVTVGSAPSRPACLARELDRQQARP